MIGLRLALPAVALALAGCGPDPYAGRNAVTGKVTLKGEPLVGASVTFLPQDHQGTETAAVTDPYGEFRFPRESGLKAGKYLIRINAPDGLTPAGEEEFAAPGGSTNRNTWDRIPADWNLNSKQVVEVTAGGENNFIFDIPAPADPPRMKR